MRARAGNVIFWASILLATVWFLAVLGPGSGARNDVTAYVMGGVIVLIGWALRYVLSREEAPPSKPLHERSASDDAGLDAMAGYHDPGITLEEISDKLDVIELRLMRIKTEVTTVGVGVLIGVALLYFR